MQQRLDASGRYPRWVLLAALSGMFATTYPVTLLAVSQQTIADDFGASVQLISWVLAAPLLCSSIALPVLGKLGDLHGHRRVFLTGFTISTAVTALTTLAWDPYSLIALRALAVTIGAATVPSSMALINGVHAPEDRVKAMGWWSLVAAGSPAIGLIVGGPLIDAVGWRPVFGIQAVLSLGAVTLAWVVLRETAPRTDVGFDLPGALSLALGAGGLMFALNQAPASGFTGPVIGALALGTAGVVSFVRVERRAPYPLLPLHLFGRRNFTASLVGSLFAGSAYMGGFVLSPLLLQNLFGMSVAATSLIMLLRTASFSASSPLGSALSKRFGERRSAVAGCTGIVVALAAMGAAASADLLALALVALVFQGVGNGLSQPPLSASLSNAVDEHDLGIAAAAQRMTWQLGSALGITVMTAVYGGTEAAPDFAAAYYAGAILGAAGLIATWFLASTPRAATSAEAVVVDDHVELAPAVAGNQQATDVANPTAPRTITAG